MRVLVRPIAFHVLPLLGLDCHAQSLKDTLRSPYDPNGDHNTWGIKGKAFPFPAGDHLGLAAFLGVEYGFLKHHSLGVDGFIAHTFGTYDAFTDTAGVEHPDGGSTWTTYKAVFVNYRCYLGFPSWRESGWSPYVGAFFRHGTVNGMGDEEYAKTDLEFHETHISGGPLVGMLYQFDRWGRWGLDMNMGVFRKHIDEVRYDLVGGSLVQESGSREFTSVRVGLNAYVWFFRR